jgi:hypothetical protein
LDYSIPRIKGVQVKKIRTGFRFLMDDLKDVVARWSNVAENDEEWEEIVGHIEFRLQWDISEKIRKKFGHGVITTKVKVEKESRKRKELEEADIKEPAKTKDIKLRDPKTISDVGTEISKLEEDGEN